MLGAEFLPCLATGQPGNRTGLVPESLCAVPPGRCIHTCCALELHYQWGGTWSLPVGALTSVKASSSLVDNWQVQIRYLVQCTRCLARLRRTCALVYIQSIRFGKDSGMYKMRRLEIDRGTRVLLHSRLGIEQAFRFISLSTIIHAPRLPRQQGLLFPSSPHLSAVRRTAAPAPERHSSLAHTVVEQLPLPTPK